MRLQTNTLPLTQSDDLHTSPGVVLPVKPVTFSLSIMSQQRRSDVDSIQSLRGRDTNQPKGGWKEIPVGNNEVAGAAGCDVTGPGDDQRNTNPPLVHVGLRAAKTTSAIEELRIVSPQVEG